MKRIVYILLAMAATMALVCSCDQAEDTFEKEKSAIVKYLTSRRIVAEEEVADVIEDNPPFYTEFARSSYRHIVNYYDEGRQEWEEVTPDSTVDIEFDAYIFSGSEPSRSLSTSVYWSNSPTTIAALSSASVNPVAKLDWTTDPLVISLGRTRIIRGIEKALIGCRDQDSVQIYMTSSMAYGKREIGTVPRNSSVAWYIKILNVSK